MRSATQAGRGQIAARDAGESSWEVFAHTQERSELKRTIRSLQRRYKPIIRSFAAKRARNRRCRRMARNLLKLWPRCGRSPPTRACPAAASGAARQRLRVCRADPVEQLPPAQVDIFVHHRRLAGRLALYRDELDWLGRLLADGELLDNLNDILAPEQSQALLARIQRMANPPHQILGVLEF
jgi:hypothetical protein